MQQKTFSLQKEYICDRSCENQPSGRIKIALFFQLCPFITPDPFEITTQMFYHTCRI